MQTYLTPFSLVLQYNFKKDTFGQLEIFFCQIKADGVGVSDRVCGTEYLCACRHLKKWWNLFL